MAITKAEVDELLQQDSGAEGRTLSVYLETDQSRQANLNRGFVVALAENLRRVERQATGDRLRDRFRADAGRVMDAAERCVPHGRSLVCFCDSGSGFFFERELAIPMRTQVRWEQKPWVRPLVELLDDYERYAAVVVDKQEARLFTVWLGEIEEHREMFSERRKRFKQTARDNVMSQPSLQRRDDEHVNLHLKSVADALDSLASERAFDRLVLGGSHELLKALQSHFPKRLQELVASETPLPIEATEHDVLQTTMEVAEKAERAVEADTVARLITAAAKGSQAVLGLEGTLESMRLGRIMQLVYADNYTRPGHECSKCASLFSETVDACVYCGGRVTPVEDVVSSLVDRVVESGGDAECVHGEAADRLRPHGSVGALLRY